jgi:predicted metal-dependent phosphotriesterase family hydrolase
VLASRSDVRSPHVPVKPTTNGRVQTVLGAIGPADLGFTLPAEHIYQQGWEIGDISAYALWQLEDDDVWVEEIDGFKRVGGTCLVDLTVACMGRRPERLKKLSQRTGVNIVMATGWYVENFVPPTDNLERRSVNSIAEQMIKEIEEGVGSTGIRAGVIGEFGARASWVTPLEERIHRAAARAHQQTGAPMSTHSERSEVGLLQLDILEEEGADLSKVAVGHCDSWPMLDYWTRVAERGAYVQLDNIGIQMGRHEERLATLARDMIERGYERQLLFSHDVGMAPELRYYGGRGFVYLSETFLPRLRELGVSDDVLETITVENPKRFLTISG